MSEKLKNFIYKNIYQNILSNNMYEIIELKRKRKYYKNKIIFIHVPKAAGTSISYSVYSRTLGHFKARLLKKVLGDLFDKSFKFSVVRNPYNRVRSAYKFVKQNGTGIMGIRNKKVYSSYKFDTFESFVKLWLKETDITKEDYVFQPQYLFTHDENKNILLDKVWKLEEFEKFTREIIHYIDIEQIYHLNESSKDKKEYVWPEELREIVYEKYKDDFLLFGYEK
ncbi:sulfotransferase family 2 domain-containing protein [Sulfurimonas sp.]|uniref:sulfotransferase family 2 domain-containing protein n=1 Tax=Sulfurimonas sp. TaxID=2022749 RepID=UPI003D13BF70